MKNKTFLCRGAKEKTLTDPYCLNNCEHGVIHDYDDDECEYDGAHGELCKCLPWPPKQKKWDD